MWTLQEHIGRVVNAGPREAAAALDKDEDDDREGAGRQRALQELAVGCAIPLSFLSPLNRQSRDVTYVKLLFQVVLAPVIGPIPVFVNPFYCL